MDLFIYYISFRNFLCACVEGGCLGGAERAAVASTRLRGQRSGRSSRLVLVVNGFAELSSPPSFPSIPPAMRRPNGDRLENFPRTVGEKRRADVFIRHRRCRPTGKHNFKSLDVLKKTKQKIWYELPPTRSQEDEP